MISNRFDHAFPRPTMVRIHEISGGNPFYALELARVIGTAEAGNNAALPDTLVELVKARVGSVDDDVRRALLAAACVATPTVEVVAVATGGDTGRAIGLLEQAEVKGIVAIDGHRVRFAHPLLARGIYTGAATAHRRDMHRWLAEFVTEPELKARHLALAAATGDPSTLDALDKAAKMARVRGASAAAAELLELALTLGGDTRTAESGWRATISTPVTPAALRSCWRGRSPRLGQDRCAPRRSLCSASFGSGSTASQKVHISSNVPSTRQEAILRGALQCW